MSESKWTIFDTAGEFNQEAGQSGKEVLDLSVLTQNFPEPPVDSGPKKQKRLKENASKHKRNKSSQNQCWLLFK